ncbi:unnamed protein product, partial [Brachionus calyciflorus]
MFHKETLGSRNMESGLEPPEISAKTFVNEKNLKDHKIENLEANLFKGYTNLKVLNLDNNQIRKIPENIFNDLKNLEFLFLSENQITRLEGNIFKGLLRLEQIHLNSNKIEYLDENIFDGLSSLQQIFMSRNKIQTLNKNIFKNKKLYKLNFIVFSENLISDLDEDIFNDLKRMVTINFAKNRIKSLSSKLFRGLSFLENIGFDFNLIESIPQGMFSNLYSLLVTDFSNNRINFFDIDQLPKSLWIIDFTQNFNINDFWITYDSCFSFKEKNFWGFEEKQKEEYYKAIQYYLEFESKRKIWILSDDIKVKFKKMIDSPNKYQIVQMYRINVSSNVDNVNYLTRNTDFKKLKSRFCSIFLNKSRTNPNALFSANPKNCLDSLNFNQRLEKLENLDWS